MRKLFALLFLFVSVAYTSSKVEIYAAHMSSKGDIVLASGSVNVVYRDYFLTAQKAKYNRKTQDLELFENIRINYKGRYKVIGEYAKLNLAQKHKEFKPFYMLDTISEVWMNGNEGVSQDVDVDVTSGMVSGCDPIDPLWKVAFSSSDYNTESMWLNIYNARFYLYDIPLFYTPYFGYSLDTTRRTGLLMPSIGVSQSEGVYFEQPIYIAEQNWWDLELKPQIRTKRGLGLYTKFRFVDSPVSKGYLDLGYFKEKSSYFNSSEVSLNNQQHYGWDFGYTNSDFINQWFGLTLGGQSGLYVDTMHMNDVEYINLASNNAQEQATSNQVISRINAFYNTDAHYVGAYFKYYQNLDKINDDQTLQQLPTLHYHSYMDTFLQDHLLYSLDVQSKNLQRQIGTDIVRTDINLPVVLQTDMLDEYLNIAYKANLYMQHSAFRNSYDSTINYHFQDGYYLRNYHTLQASTQLVKRYDGFVHTLGLLASYNKKGDSRETGYYHDKGSFCSLEANRNNPICEFYNISSIQEQANFDITQYFYDDENNELLYHRLSQKVSYEKDQNRLGELENELEYKITKHLSFYNNTFYNHKFSQFTKVLNTLSYQSSDIRLNLSHLFRYDIANVGISDPYSKYLTSSVGYDYNEHYSFSGVFNYDIQQTQRKALSFGFTYKKRCWEFGLKYSENNRPVLDAGGNSSSVYDKYVFVSIVLKPFMQPNPNGSLFEYKVSKQ